MVGTIPVTDNRWHHVACTFKDEGTANVEDVKLYVDGRLESISISVGRAVNTIGGEQDVYIGTDHTNRCFNGQMAHMRIYNRALTAGEVKAVMQEDQIATEAFKTEYPVAFNLYDDDERNVFYISSENTLNNFELEIENVSNQNIQINALEDGNDVIITEATAIDHHLELKFKANTFDATIEQGNDSEAYLRGFTLPDDWVASDAFEHTDGKVSLYLLYQGEGPCELNAGNTLGFTLQYGSADGTGGARGTTVELLYKNIYNENDSTFSFSGTRIQSTDIINQRGKKDIPLHVGIVGSNTILNDADPGIPASGTAGSLKIRLVNTLKDAPLLFNTGNIDTEKNTKFTLLFDNPVGEDWDLASENELNAIDVNGTSCDVVKNEQGSIPVVEITPSVSQLDAQASIEIELNNIHSSSPSGFSNIYLKYEDIPGYWDGQFVVQVEKSPIVHRDIDGNKNVGIGIVPDADNQLKVSGNVSVLNGNVGIGTVTPQNRLDVEGGTVIGSSYASSETAPSDGLLIEGKVGIGTDSPEDRLHIKGIARMQATNDPANYLKIGYGGTHAFISAYGAGKLNFRHEGADKMTLDQSGNLGIGTVTPKNKLDVEGGAVIGSGYSGSETAPENGLLIQGNIGIGTTSPDNKLTVFDGELALQTNDNTQDQGLLFQNSGGAYTWRLYRSDAGGNYADLKFASGSTDNYTELIDRMVIDKDGNVGIGTDSPEDRLHIKGIARMQATNDPANYLKIGHGGTHAFISAYGAGNLDFRYDGETKMTLDQSGKLGIGTTAPKNKLDVEGSAVIGSSYSGSQTAPSDGLLVQGNVGIGTTSPAYKLHVAGSIGIDDYIRHNQNPNSYIRFLNSYIKFYHSGNTVSIHSDYVSISKDIRITGDIWNKPHNSNGKKETGWFRIRKWANATNDKAVFTNDTTVDTYPSDQRLKKNIQAIPNAMEKIVALRGVAYEWNDLGLARKVRNVEQDIRSESGTEEDNRKIWDAEKEKIYKTHSGIRRGFIAQEIEDIFPEWVKEDEDGYKTINTDELCAFLVQGIKELKTEKDKEIAQLKNTVNEMKIKLEKL